MIRDRELHCEPGDALKPEDAGAVRLRVSDRGGWILVRILAEDLPPAYRHASTLPRVRVQVDAGSIYSLDETGKLRIEG